MLSHIGLLKNFMIFQDILSKLIKIENNNFIIAVFHFFLMPLFDLRQKKEGAIPCRRFLKLITILAKET